MIIIPLQLSCLMNLSERVGQKMNERTIPPISTNIPYEIEQIIDLVLLLLQRIINIQQNLIMH